MLSPVTSNQDDNPTLQKKLDDCANEIVLKLSLVHTCVDTISKCQLIPTSAVPRNGHCIDLHNKSSCIVQAEAIDCCCLFFQINNGSMHFSDKLPLEISTVCCLHICLLTFFLEKICFHIGVIYRISLPCTSSNPSSYQLLDIICIHIYCMNMVSKV